MTADASPPAITPAGAELTDTDAPGGDVPSVLASDADAAGVPEPVYAAVEDWVNDYFLPMFRRTLGGEFRWCAQWWRHGEAISRLTSLWHAWEVLRLRPGTGIATWYRDHLDHQLPILMGARGPFYQCSETAHREPREAAAVPAPTDWWDAGEDVDGVLPDDRSATEADDGATGPPRGESLPGPDEHAGAGEDLA